MRNWLAEWRARDLDRDLRDEMRSHMEMRAAEFEQQGMSPRDALAAAHKQFGSTAIAHEDARRMHIGPVAAGVESAARELRFALRSLRRSPSFTFAAVLALALGVGAASAVFSVADRILFRGLPYAGGDRLVSPSCWAAITPNGRRNAPPSPASSLPAAPATATSQKPTPCA